MQIIEMTKLIQQSVGGKKRATMRKKRGKRTRKHYFNT
jgi:hypothetical protein